MSLYIWMVHIMCCRFHGNDCFRYVDEPVAQASTSHQHYYSQPGSILAPEPQISKEQLEALIRQEDLIGVVLRVTYLLLLLLWCCCC